VNWPAVASTCPDALPFAGDLDQDAIPGDIGAYDPGTRIWYFDNNHDGSPSSKSRWGECSDLRFTGNLWNNQIVAEDALDGQRATKPAAALDEDGR